MLLEMAAAANAICNLTLLIKTTHKESDNRDLMHNVIITQDKSVINELEKENYNYWEGSGNAPFTQISKETITVDKEVSSIYIVFHYHDNYADSINTFKTKEEALEFYKKEITSMILDIPDMFYVKSEKLNENTLMSTLYDEDDNYPDKGDRWVYTKVDFKSCIGKVGGTRRRKSKKAKKSRKHKRV